MVAERDLAEVAEGVEELPGSDVVVVSGAELADQIARRAPAAVIVVAGGAEVCDAVLAGTLFPRGRVVGAAGDGIGPLVDAIVLDRRVVLDCLGRVQQDGGFVPATARIGARGVEEFL